MVMGQQQYGENYFRAIDGNVHLAGYSNYARSFMANGDDSLDQGELFRTMHFKFYGKFSQQIDGKKVLCLGAGLGFEVADLSEFSQNRNIRGVEWSSWAVANAEVPLIEANAITYLQSLQPGEVDTIIGIRFLPCLSDRDITELKRQIARLGCESIFVVDDNLVYTAQDIVRLNSAYNIKLLSAWQTLFPNSMIESMSMDTYRWLR